VEDDYTFLWEDDDDDDDDNRHLGTGIFVYRMSGLK
jgi:hypothetical protein